jgi:MFS family permease
MPPLATHKSWLIILGLSLGPAVGNGIARFAYGLVLPAMRQDLGWTYTQAGWLNTANAIGYLIGALLALALIGRLGPRALFIGGMIVTALALLASGLTRDFWWLTAWRIATGIGGAPVFIAGGAMVSTLFGRDASRSALAIAVYFGGGGLGMLFCGLTLPHLLDAFGPAFWPKIWLLLAAVSSVACVPSIAAAVSVPLSSQSRGGAVAEPLPIARMAAALSGYFIFAIGYIVYLTFLVAWMRSTGASSTLISATWATLGLGVMLSPWPWRRMLARAEGGGALGLATAATGVGTLLPLLIHDATGLVLSAAVFGLSFFIAPTSVTAFGRKNLPEAQWGRAVALFTAIFAVGQTVGPVAAGAIADATQDLTSGLLVSGVILLIGGVVGALQGPLLKRAH